MSFLVFLNKFLIKRIFNTLYCIMFYLKNTFDEIQ